MTTLHRSLLIKWAKVRERPLYLNSLYLMTSTLIMAILGFLYWLAAAQLYPPAEVGIAATLVSIMTYVSMISQLGINAGLMRFLPKSGDKTIKINTSLTFVTIAAITVSLVFLLGVKRLTPDLAYLSMNGFSVLSFVIFMVFGAVNLSVESVLIALRNGSSVLLKNSLLSIGKVAFLFIFVAFGSYGLFASWALATVVATVFALAVLVSSYGYKPQLRVCYADVREMAGYSIGNYIASIIGNLPQYLLPLVLTVLISPIATAHFNMAMSYAALLFSVPVSICNSLLVEGATDEDSIRRSTIGAIKLITLILIPVILIILLFGEKGLSIFGSEYSTNSAPLLSMLAVSSIFVAVNTVCWTILNLYKRVNEIILALTTNALIIMILCRLLVGKGLIGIGAAWIIGQAITSGIYLIIMLRHYKLADLSLRR